MNEDPFIAALRKAPHASAKVRARMLALDAEATGDPRDAMMPAQFTAAIDAEQVRRERRQKIE